MCPSTSCGTRPGSQFGIWLATAVIRPKTKEVRPRRKRMKRSAARRSLRIFRRRRLEPGAWALRLRRNKRRILALGGVLHPHEGLARRSLGAPGALLGDHHQSPVRDATLERHRHDLAAVEQAGGLWRIPGRDPRLVGSARAGRSELPEHERALSVPRYDECPALERD